MIGLLARLVPHRWRDATARSARLRLTLMYSGMFVLLGTAVVVIISLLIESGSAIRVTQSVEAVPHGTRTIIHSVVAKHPTTVQVRLLGVTWLVLVFTAIVSLPLGWFAAGRVLRPLRQMTGSARTITAGNLHQRLALAGPDDEFKQLGDTIDDLLARLEAAFGAQRRFVANAAHELRTPLTLERTLLQVALANPNASEASLRATCQELLDSGRDQERLLDALLTLATSDRGLERREPVDLAALAERALGEHRGELERRALKAEHALSTAPALGDPSLLRRLIANLIDNAVRYNQPGGWVALETSSASGGAVLSVANTGPRIPDDAVERLFEPFQRLGRERTHDNGHHGLGLSIARAIATAHGATIAAEPRPDGGLIVTVRLRSIPAPEERVGSG